MNVVPFLTRSVCGVLITLSTLFAFPSLQAKARSAKNTSVHEQVERREFIRFSEKSGSLPNSNADIVIAAGSIASCSGTGNRITLEEGGLSGKDGVLRIVSGAVAKLLNESARNTLVARGHPYTVKGCAEATIDQEEQLVVKYFNGTEPEKTEWVRFSPDGNYEVRIANATGTSGLIEYDSRTETMTLSGVVGDITDSNITIVLQRGANIILSGSGNKLFHRHPYTGKILPWPIKH